MADDMTEDTELIELVELACKHTKIFTNNQKNLFTREFETSFSTSDNEAIKEYYKKHIEDKLSNDPEKRKKQLKKFKTQISEKTLLDFYINRAVTLAMNSVKQIDQKKVFINPMTLEQETLPESTTLNDHITNLANEELKTALNDDRPLPRLPNDTEWQETTNKIFPVQKEPSLEISSNLDVFTIPIQSIDSGFVSKLTEENEEKSGNLPANNTVSATDSKPGELDGFKKAIFINDELRQQLVPRMSHLNKSFYIIQMRNFLRILKRLYNITTLRKGLLKELTYVRLVSENNFAINQPFFKKMNLAKSDTIYERIYKNMGINHYKKIKSI